MRAPQFSEYGPVSVVHVAEAPEPHAGPGQIRVTVRASGVTPADTYLRSGRFREWLMVPLPHVPGVDAAGVVDEIGADVTGVEVGDAVVGIVDLARFGGANADYAVLACWAPKPVSWSWEEAGHRHGRCRHAGVPGRAGAIPTTYGDGLRDRVAALAPNGVDAVLDCVGSGSIPDLVAIAGGAERVVTIVDDPEAVRLGVHMSRSAGPDPDPQAPHGLTEAAAPADQGRFSVPLAGVFPLEDAAAAYELSESGHAHGKIVLTTARRSPRAGSPL